MEATRGAGGGRGYVALILVSAKRKVFLNGFNICSRNERHLSEVPLALAILVLQQVTLALFPAQNLPSTCHLESFGDSLPGLCFS
jgi:hypothetical protein